MQKDQEKDPDEEVGIVFADSSGPFAQLTMWQGPNWRRRTSLGVVAWAPTPYSSFAIGTSIKVNHCKFKQTN